MGCSDNLDGLEVSKDCKQEFYKHEKDMKRGIKKAKKRALTGFAKIAGDLRNKFVKLWNRKKIAGFLLIKETEKTGGECTGGIVGDLEAVFIGLYDLAQKNKSVKYVVLKVAEAVRAKELRSFHKIEDLVERGEVSAATQKALLEKLIGSLTQLTVKTEKEVSEIKGIGAKGIEELKAALKIRNWYFYKEENNI